MKMEATCSSETSVDFQRTTWRYIPEDGTLYLEYEVDYVDNEWNHVEEKFKELAT
jgi:hypothetical protein